MPPWPQLSRRCQAYWPTEPPPREAVGVGHPHRPDQGQPAAAAIRPPRRWPARTPPRHSVERRVGCSGADPHPVRGESPWGRAITRSRIPSRSLTSRRSTFLGVFFHQLNQRPQAGGAAELGCPAGHRGKGHGSFPSPSRAPVDGCPQGLEHHPATGLPSCGGSLCQRMWIGIVRS